MAASMEQLQEAIDMTHGELVPVLDMALQRLAAVQKEIGARNALNCYPHDDVQACIVFANALKEKLGGLVTSLDTLTTAAVHQMLDGGTQHHA